MEIRIARLMGIAWFFLSLVMVISTQRSDAATTYDVGGSLRWRVPPNTSFYKEWTEGKTFHVGDVLSFNWAHVHDVTENITKEEYDNCTTTSSVIDKPVVNRTLNSPGSHYYICTIGNHCSRGQKLEIQVLASNSSAPAGSGLQPPSPSSSNSCVPQAALSATIAFLLFSFTSTHV